MKYSKLTILTLIWLCIGCEPKIPDSNIYLWNRFPDEKFFSYYENMVLNPDLNFVSDNGGLLEFCINYYDYINNFYLSADTGYLQGGGEIKNWYVEEYRNKTTKLRLQAEVYNRYYVGFYLDINVSGSLVEAQFVRKIPYDENYMPYDPDLITTYLTDTINMYNRQGNYVAKLVSGKGLVSFTDESGVEWQLVE